jgi:hypothetical protein
MSQLEQAWPGRALRQPGQRQRRAQEVATPMLQPGLPSEPNAWKVDLHDDGNVVGLF